MFPDNTSQCWNIPCIGIPDTNWMHIVWEFQHEGEFMHIAQLKMLLDSQEFGSALRIKYLPYARQDKNVSNETTFALHSFAKLLNSLDFAEVILHDPHSEVALKLINNSRAVYPKIEVQKAMELTSSDCVCYPDKGAVQKYKAIYDYPAMSGDKVRDQATGNITSYKLVGNPANKKVLIIDDLCDYGNTFIKLAAKLQDAKEINLFVSHGLFSGGLKHLHAAGIKRIFTKDGEVSEVQNVLTYRKI